MERESLIFPLKYPLSIKDHKRLLIPEQSMIKVQRKEGNFGLRENFWNCVDRDLSEETVMTEQEQEVERQG